MPTAETKNPLFNSLPDISAESTPQPSSVIVTAATPIRQKRKPYMSKRFQTGSVRLVGKMWHGRYWRDAPGKEKRDHPLVVLGSKSEMTKPEARRKLLDIIEKEGLNDTNSLERLVVPAVPALTFNDVANAWELRRLPKLKVSTRHSAPKQIAKHLRPFFGALTLGSIKTGTLDEWIAGLEKSGLEPKTVHNQWKQFRAIMNWHAQQKDEPKRAWCPSLPSVPETEQRWFTQEEMRRIVAAAKGQYKVLFHLAGFSGLRSGELSGLHVEDIDFVRGVVRVERSVWRGIEVSTKTKKGHRNVFVDSSTVRMLKEYLGDRTTAHAFQTKNGTPLENHNIVRQVLKPICKRLGIEPGGMHGVKGGSVTCKRIRFRVTLQRTKWVTQVCGQPASLHTHFDKEFIRDTVERLSGSSTQSL